MKLEHVLEVLQALIKYYKQQDFTITHILADDQFKSMRHDLSKMRIDLNIVFKDEYEPEAERFNHTVKEQCRRNFAMIPFKNIPKHMVVKLL